MAGEWTNTVRGPKDPPPLIYADPRAYSDPALKKEYAQHMKMGTMSVTSTLRLGADHHFAWDPVQWSGTWEYRNGTLTLRPEKNWTSLNALNGYSVSSTHGVPDVTMSYSPSDKALRWTYGWKQFNGKVEMVFKKSP